MLILAIVSEDEVGAIEQVVTVIGALLGIAAFFMQYGKRLVPKKKQEEQGSSHDVFSTLRDVLFSRRVITGVVLSVMAALIWSISYSSYRDESIRALSPVVVAAPIFLISGAVMFLLALIRARGNIQSLLATHVYRGLATRTGLALIASNTLEFFFIIYAIQLISAGQTIALYKINPLLIMGLLYVLNRKRVAHASIAAVFAVLIGVYLILFPDFRGMLGGQQLLGSGIALLGAFSFALYSVSVYNYPLKYEDSTTGQRIAAQAAVFFIGGLALVLVSFLIRADWVFSSSALTIILVNGVRAGVVYVCYTEAIKRINPILVSCIVALEVPLTMAIEHFWYDEPITRSLAIGAVIMLIGVASIFKENEMFKAAWEDRLRRRKQSLDLKQL